MRVHLLAIAAVFLCAHSPVSAQMISNGSIDSGESSFLPGSDYVENNGLAVRVLFVSEAQGAQRTASLELKNMQDAQIWLALIGPPPTAVDTSGNSYSISTVAGIGACTQLATNQIAWCMENYSGRYLPGSVFTGLSPGASSIVNFTLTAKSNDLTDTGFLSLTMSVAMGEGDQPESGADRALKSIPVSFPLVPLEAK